MSEHQIVAFRAVDGPVGEKNLEYMEQQSSRAEITPWSFDNEYHYGDFRGNADEMLRRGRNSPESQSESSRDRGPSASQETRQDERGPGTDAARN